MLGRTIVICLIGLLSLSFIPLSIMLGSDERIHDLQVRDGVMDLSAWDYGNQKRIALDGEWEFYWNQLLTPENFRQEGGAAPAYTTLMRVPSQWNGTIVNGNPLPAYGSATYRMVLRNLPVGGMFALKKPNIRFSSVVYIDGQKLLEDGKTSMDEATYEPGNIPQIGFFTSDQRDVEIIIQVSNYDYINSGIPVSLYFGQQDAMIEQQQKSMVREFSPLVILGALALIYFICFVAASLYRKRDYALLLIAVICLLYAIYHGLIGERALLLFFPEISFEALYKAKDVSSIACFIILAFFFHQLQKSIISSKLTQAVAIVLGGFLILVPFLSISIYMTVHAYIIVFYELLLIWLLLRAAVLHIKSEADSRFKSLLLFMAVLMINLYSVDTILFAIAIKDNLWLGQSYIIIFNIIMIFFIVLRFFEAYRTIDEMKNQLLKLDKIKDDFLSNTSHELKTPLNAIVSITDSLLKGVEGPVTERQAQNLGIVMGSGRRLTHLVNELLDYSKMKHGDITLYKSFMDLKAAVDSVIRIHLFLLGDKRVTLVNSIPEELPAVYADGNRLMQILHNLIGNAVKFSERGEVDISAEVIRDRIEVRIQDRGIGIAAHMQERIFMAFEQGAASETNHDGGTGLGLSITRKLVELHGGHIHVESMPGEGSIFIFTIPLAEASSHKMLRQAEPMERPRKEASVPHIEYPFYVKGELDEPILVVDDDYANLQSMINLLKLEGYSIVVVNRGQLALEELTRKRAQVGDGRKIGSHEQALERAG